MVCAVSTLHSRAQWVPKTEGLGKVLSDADTVSLQALNFDLIKLSILLTPLHSGRQSPQV